MFSIYHTESETKPLIGWIKTEGVKKAFHLQIPKILLLGEPLKRELLGEPLRRERMKMFELSKFRIFVNKCFTATLNITIQLVSHSI